MKTLKAGISLYQRIVSWTANFLYPFERPIDQQEVRQLAGYIDGLRSEYKDVVIGIGPIVCELIKFHHSFDLARDRLSAQAQPAMKLLMEDEKQ